MPPRLPPPLLAFPMKFILASCLLFGLIGAGSALAQPEPTTAAGDFSDAFKLYSDRLYEPALEAFADFRRRYPDHPNAAEALYYQAQTALALGHETQAVYLFNLFQEQYPVHPLAPQTRLAVGKYFYDQGRYDRAIEALEQVLAEGPPPGDGARALYWMGEAALAKGDTGQALGYFRRVADAYRTTTTASTALYTIAFIEVQQERYDEAARAFEQLAARYPESPYAKDIGLALAEIYYELDDFSRTVDEVKRRLSGLTGEARERAIFLLAESYNQLGDSENAIVYYRDVIELGADRPYHRPAIYGLGWNYYFEGAHQWAAREFARVKEGHDDVLAEKATYYEAVNHKLAADTRSALATFDEAATRWPNGVLTDHALYELGITRYEERMWEDASTAFARLVSNHRDSDLYPEALQMLGYTYVALGRFDEAFEQFDRAVALDAAPQSLREEITFQKAWLFYRQRQYPQASTAFLDLYEANPQAEKAGESLFWAAESFYQSGEMARAEDLFKQYLRDYRGGSQADAAHYALGWTYFKRGRYAEAAREFETFLSEYRGEEGYVPYRTDARLRLGDSYYALKRYREAVRAYNDVGESGADYALYQTAQAHSNAGDAFDAITAFRRLLSEYPESEWREEAQFSLANLYFLNQDYDQAVTEYRALMREYPGDRLAAKAQYGIGDALFNAGRMGASVAAYRKVLEDFPSSPFAADAASSIVYALLAQDDEARTTAFIDSFATANPGSPLVDELRFRQAEVSYQGGRKDAALRAFQRYLREAGPGDRTADASYYLGAIYAERGQTGEAETYLRRAVDNSRSTFRADAAERLGELYLEGRRYDEALRVYRDLEGMRPGDAALTARAQYGQSVALLELGRAPEAERVLEAALRADPDALESAPARLGLARVYEATGRAGEAINLYRQVVQRSRDETGAEALFRLGALLTAQGNARAAIEELTRMATLFAGYPEWLARGYLQQARAYQRLGLTGDASRLYDQVINEYAGTPFAATASREKEAL